MKEQTNRDEAWSLWWGAQRSIRYHDKCISWLTRAEHIFRFAILLMVGSVVSAALKDDISKAVLLSRASLLLVAIYLLNAPGQRAQQHITLYAAFSYLVRDIAVIGWENLSAAQLANLEARRYEIECFEPPVNHWLNIRCHRELSRAIGMPDLEGECPHEPHTTH